MYKQAALSDHGNTSHTCTKLDLNFQSALVRANVYILFTVSALSVPTYLDFDGTAQPREFELPSNI